MNYRKSLKCLVLIIGIVSGLFACNAEDKSENSEKQTYKSVGIVKAINTGKGEITIDHKDIPGLMSAMTMDFPVADKKLLESIEVGDKVDFEIEKNAEKMTVTSVKKIGEVAQINASEIYKANCAKCHGEKGEGVEGKGLSFLEGHALDHPEEDFIKQVTYGEEDEMPAFKDKLAAEEIVAVVKYVRREIQKGKRNDQEDKTHKH